jgi:hypothetical protein
MDLWQLKPGDKVRTADGALVEVVTPTEDGRWILVRYLSDPENPSVVGTEDLCHDEELAEMVQPASQ